MKFATLLTVAAVASLAVAEPQPIKPQASTDTAVPISNRFFDMPPAKRTPGGNSGFGLGNPIDGAASVPSASGNGARGRGLGRRGADDLDIDEFVPRRLRRQIRRRVRSIARGDGLEDEDVDEDELAARRRRRIARIRALRRRARRRIREVAKSADDEELDAGARRRIRRRLVQQLKRRPRGRKFRVRTGEGKALDCFCRRAGRVAGRRVRGRGLRGANRRRGIPSKLRAFCNKLVYVNGKPSFNKSPRTRLLPYTKPKFPATARATRNGGLVIQRDGAARNLESGALHKYGFQTASAVKIPKKAKLVRFYAQVRFREGKEAAAASGTTPAKKCAVKHAAVSFYYGSRRVGGRVFRDASLPVGKWLPISVTARAGALPSGPQRITLQGAHNFADNDECRDNLEFEVRRIMTCANTKRTLFQTAAKPQFATSSAAFAVSEDAVAQDPADYHADYSASKDAADYHAEDGADYADYSATEDAADWADYSTEDAADYAEDGADYADYSAEDAADYAEDGADYADYAAEDSLEEAEDAGDYADYSTEDAADYAEDGADYADYSAEDAADYHADYSTEDAADYAEDGADYADYAAEDSLEEAEDAGDYADYSTEDAADYAEDGADYHADYSTEDAADYAEDGADYADYSVEDGADYAEDAADYADYSTGAQAQSGYNYYVVGSEDAADSTRQAAVPATFYGPALPPGWNGGGATSPNTIIVVRPGK
ncbi:hypothetical protein H9P43_007040 [Blastocladiella emersonii ATCC 22665]|nr:hypothetical protein H9P43_007040 [Blastocladiella emersonii ATCC 22665]